MNLLRLFPPSRPAERVFLAMVFGMGLLSLWLDWPQSLQQTLYHTMMRIDPRLPSEQILLITIDDASLQQLGDLPWSRHHYADVIQYVAPQAQQVALLPPLTHTQLSQGRTEAHALLTFYQHNAAAKPETQSDEQRLLILHDLLLDLRHQLDGDQQLLYAIQQYPQVTVSIPVYLSNSPVFMNEQNESITAASEILTQMAIHHEQNGHTQRTPAIQYLFLPFPSLVQSARLAIVPLNLSTPERIPLLVRYQDNDLPTLPLVLLQQIKANQLIKIKSNGSTRIQFADRVISTDPQAQLHSRFYPLSSFNQVSFVDVLNGTIDPSLFKDKIVLIGITALPYSVWQNTPFGQQSSLHLMASGLSSLLQNDFLMSPSWIYLFYGGMVGLFGIYLIFVLPVLSTSSAFAITGLLFCAGIVLNALLLKQNDLVSLVGLCVVFVGCYLLLGLYQAFGAYYAAVQDLPHAFSSHRLLALAFQGQGQLDLAFAAFRRCPMEETIKGELYNLALDYENHKQNQRAIEVYHYLMQQNSPYRDVERRLERLLHPQFTPDDKPLLGHYQLERCLSKGAMGTVYLARDAKLDRLVAIKTLALAREFSANQLQEALIRFFREAAAVGRLRHPHIIHIYDAGEEDDLAYICMEFFKGNTLVPYTHVENLLAKKTLLELMITTAEALDYAHKQGVIHRDIKPSNIMYNPGNGQLKVTDFGIARITDTQRTRTGLILGTPAYMSPEQLSGQDLDGRTDLFSFGVMLYQLLSGHLPFQADNMTTLMYRIIHESPVALRDYRPDLSGEWLAIVDRLLAKHPQDRFASGEELVQALRFCLQKESPCH
jgi:eukaryotic-like serine/threonine-protein kinase